MTEGIIFDKVSFSYLGRDKQLDNVSVSIPKGSFCAIVGPNGSGKTTLAMSINGLIPNEIQGNFGGTVTVDGVSTKSKPVSHFARSIGFVFQNPDFSLFNLTVRAEIEFVLNNLKLDKKEQRIEKALKSVGMYQYVDKDPQTLSLGQKQKISLASVLAQDSTYIVLDEPTAMLDYPSAKNLFNVLKKLNDEGKTLIVIEHDTDLLYDFAKQIIVLDKGKIKLGGDVKKVFSQKTALEKIGVKIPGRAL